MEIEGRIIRDLGETGGTSKAGNLWQKHEWVLETLGQYPRKVKFHVFGDRSKTLTFEQGKCYVVQCDVESREFNERWYTDVSVYAARPLDQPAGGVGEGATGPVFNNPSAAPTNPYDREQTGYQAAQAPAGNPFNTAPATDFSEGDSTEDLPF